MIVEGTALPSRPEVVALADAVAIASAKGDDPAGLARLAADLRVRAWRFDRADADGREALELDAAAARAAAGTERGCEADRRRALVAGELASDAAITYREVYLASRRQAAHLAQADASACLRSLQHALAGLAAYRPMGAALQKLEQEGAAVASAAARLSPPPATSIDPVASAAPAPSASVASAPGEVVVSPGQTATPRGPVKVQTIEPYGSKEAARVVVHLSGPATFEVGTVDADGDKDPRLFVDIAGASARGVAREIDVGGIVRRVRVGAQPKGTRIVLDLGEKAPQRRVFYLPEPFRIVIDVGARAPAPAQAVAAKGQRRELRRVVLDPGHGGQDDGAVGPTGLREKDVTLDIAHRAAPLLAHELKIEALLTRDNDIYVPLEARTARANAFHADLFVSIHCNASENGLARGVQTFVLDHTRSQGFAGVAARENAGRSRSGAAVTDPEALDAEMASILATLNSGATSDRSRHVADLLQRSALASLGERYPDTRDQGVRTAGFYVLAGADMPAVLLETAFISNPDDEARLATADYRQKLADAIVNAIRAYAEGK